MCYKNEKTLNNFLCSLPETAQTFEPDDLNRYIIKAETAFNEIRNLYTTFVASVKNECVMDGHFFSFTNLPDMIVRKNYNRKDYDLLKKLLVRVKDAYIEQRTREREMEKEAEDKDKSKD